MSSKDNTANADIPNINIPIWFELHRLPYNDVIVTKIQMIGNICVWRISSSLSPTTSRLCLGMKILL